MALDPAQVITRSYSDLSRIEPIWEDRLMPPEERMERIKRIVEEWDRATAGSTGRVHLCPGCDRPNSRGVNGHNEDRCVELREARYRAEHGI